jgi:hypothetical protein
MSAAEDDSRSEERQQLQELCARLGAVGPQAGVMALQLQKRCDQLVAERGWPRMEAMRHLLELVTKGVRGETPAGFEGASRPPPESETR